MLELVLEFLQLVLWMILVPFATGCIIREWLPEKARTCSWIAIAGYLVMFSVFEVIVMPMVLVQAKFSTAVTVMTVVFLVLLAAGIGFVIKRIIKKEKSLKTVLDAVGVRLPETKPDVQTIVLWIFFVVLVAFQLYQAFTLTFFDGDDAYYVAQSVTAVNRDSMYGYIPYNGYGTRLDIRHAMAELPLWIAFVAKHTGIHSTIVSHTIIPFLFIPLTYLAYYQIARRVCTTNKRQVPAFLIIMGVLQIFGNVSIYTKETFMIMRTWQGKSLFSNFVLAVTLAIILWIFGEAKEEASKRDNGFWLLLFCTNIAAAFCTTMGVFLMAIFIGVTGICLSIRNRSVKVLWKFVVSCIPCVVFTVLYLAMK